MTASKPILALVAAAAAMLPLRSADAASTITETQRIEWSSGADLPSGAGYGGRVAIAETADGLAAVGAPGSGEMEFLSLDNPSAVWQPTSAESGDPQARATSSDGAFILWCREEWAFNHLTTTVLASSTILVEGEVGGRVEAVVRDGDVLVAGRPDIFGGLVTIFEDDGSGTYSLRDSSRTARINYCSGRAHHAPRAPLLRLPPETADAFASGLIPWPERLTPSVGSELFAEE
jgi:hypothetical protein